MQWYYANNGQRSGPISDADFQSLVAAGTVKGDTLVWRPGMANWLPYAQVAPTLGAAAPATPPPATPLGAEGVPQATVATPHPGATPAPEALMFTGIWTEYFKIWIVNVLLTIVTLGIYAAWAKVRKKRYFYANTQLFGHAFEYLADPKRILIGNLIVVGVFLIYSLSGAISPFVQLPFAFVIALIVPFFICRSLSFNARNSMWRGLRFNFTGRYVEALVAFVLLPIATLFTLGALHPYGAKKRKEFVMRNHSYGTTPFQFEAQTGDFYRIYGVAVLFFIPIIICYGGFIFAAVMMARNGGGAPAQPHPAMVFFGLGLIVAIPLAIVGTFFLKARIFNLVWNNTTLSGHRFVASMRARDLLLVHFLNTIVTSATLGLLHPWAAVRMVQFQLASLQVVPGGNLDEFVAASQPDVNALGDAAGDFLDFDIGVGV